MYYKFEHICFKIGHLRLCGVDDMFYIIDLIVIKQYLIVSFRSDPPVACIR